MSVTYIPAPDYSKDVQDAVQLYLNIAKTQQQLALDQQLAQSHLQTAAVERQGAEARNQILSQQASEFMAPSSVEARRLQQQNDAALSGERLKEAQFTNNTLNPLRQTGYDINNQSAQVALESARKTAAKLDELLSDEGALRKASIKTAQAKAIEAGVDAQAAQIAAPLMGTKLMMGMTSQANQLKMQQLQLDEMGKQLQTYDDTQRLKTLDSLSVMVARGASPEKIAQAFPDARFLVGMTPTGERDAKKAIMMHAAKVVQEGPQANGYDEAVNYLAQSLSGEKPKTAEQQMMESFQKKRDPNYKPDTTILDATRNYIKTMGSQKKLGGLFEDPSTSPSGAQSQSGLPSQAGGDVTYAQAAPTSQASGSFPITGGGGSIGRGLVNVLGGGSNGATQPTPAPQSGTMPLVPGATKTSVQTPQYDTKMANNAFEDIDKVIQRSGDNSKQLFVKNYSGNEKDKVATLVGHPSDPEYQVALDGTVYNSTKLNTLQAKPLKMDDLMKTRTAKSVIENHPEIQPIQDQNFKDNAYPLFKEGMTDSSATAAQTARFSAIAGQMARAYNEEGAAGLYKVLQLANSRYKYNDPNGITTSQALALAKLAKQYPLPGAK